MSTPQTEQGTEAALRLRLYVAGDAPNSTTAAANLRSAVAQVSTHRVDLEIIDVLIDPKRALRDRILMTPMLVRLEPAPERRVLGNLSNRAALLDLLALDGSKHG